MMLEQPCQVTLPDRARRHLLQQREHAGALEPRWGCSMDYALDYVPSAARRGLWSGIRLQA